MFNQLNEITVYINSIIKGGSDVDQVITSLNKEFNLQLSQSDFSNLIKRIKEIKEAEQIYQRTQNAAYSSKTGIDFTTDIIKSQERVFSANSRAYNEATRLATKTCIESYNGPLNMEVMKQLEEKGYDATYGSESMRQMFLMYQENVRVKAENNQCRSELNNCYIKINEQDKMISQQHDKITELTSENNILKQTNSELNQSNRSLSDKIKELTEQVSSLSSVVKSIPKLIIEQLSETFGHKKPSGSIEQGPHGKTL